MELNKIYNDDFLIGMDTIPDGSVDMILTDLPYGMTNNKWDTVIPFDKMWEQYGRVIKDNGAIVLTASGLFGANLMLSNPNDYKYKIVWEKSKATNFLNAKRQPLRKFEEILVFYSKQPTYNPQMRKGEPYDKGVRKNQTTGSYGEFEPIHVKSSGSRYPVDLVYFKTAESEGKVIHPTQKPVELFEYLINTYTNEGQLVLDTCMGSGTTAIACINTNRNYIGFELDEKYYNDSIDRIEKHKGEL